MASVTPTELKEAADISLSYASMLLSGERQPSATLAARIFKTTGLKLGLFASLSDDDARVAVRIHGPS